jgi:uncharacterized membrane protein
MNQIELSSGIRSPGTSIIRFSQESITVDLHEIRIDFSDMEAITVVEEMTITNNQNSTISNMSCWLNQTFINLEIEDRDGLLIHDVTSYDASNNLVSIDFRNPVEVNQTIRVSIDYILNIEVPLVENYNQTYYNFVFRKAISYYTKNFRLIIRLPYNSFIHEDESNPYSYYPEDAIIDPSGGRLYIIWDLNNLLVSSNVLFFALFDEPIRETPRIWIPLVSSIIGITFGATAVFLWTRRREKKTLKKIGSIFLADDQKLLLKLLVEAEGRLSQKDFIKLTGYTKSKISRNLIPMEKQGLITKEKWGREFRIYITKEGRKVIE